MPRRSQSEVLVYVERMATKFGSSEHVVGLDYPKDGLWFGTKGVLWPPAGVTVLPGTLVAREGALEPVTGTFGILATRPAGVEGVNLLP